MDWARAKSIILILLAVFNIFLLSKIIMDYGSQGISKETILNMEKILNGRGIELECEIPRYDKDTPRLKFGNGKANKAALLDKLLGVKLDTSVSLDVDKNMFENGLRKLILSGINSFKYTDEMPEDNVDTVHINETEKYLKKFLKERGLYNSLYVMDEKPVRQENGLVFTYLEKYKGFLVFDNYLKAVVSEKGVEYLEVRHRQIIGFSPVRIGDISAAYQILLENFDGSDKAIITAVDLGYKDVAYQAQNHIQSSEQLPVWRIKVKGMVQAKYFGASDGKEIK